MNEGEGRATSEDKSTRHGLGASMVVRGLIHSNDECASHGSPRVKKGRERGEERARTRNE